MRTALTEIVEVIKSVGGYRIITDSEPTSRTIRYEYDDMSRYNRQCMVRGDVRNGYHRLKLPYVRMVIGLKPDPDGRKNLFLWNGNISTFGSLEPYTDMGQPVFVLPMPNTSNNGAVHCCHMFRSGVGSLELVITEVIESYWSSVFSYWCADSYGEMSLRRLKGGVATLKEIPLTSSLAKLFPGGSFDRR